MQAAVDGALLEGGLGLKRGKAYLPLRAAVSGASISPPLPESMALLGRDTVLRRLRAAAAVAREQARTSARLSGGPQGRPFCGFHGVWGNWQPDGFWFR